MSARNGHAVKLDADHDLIHRGIVVIRKIRRACRNSALRHHPYRFRLPTYMRMAYMGMALKAWSASFFPQSELFVVNAPLSSQRLPLLFGERDEARRLGGVGVAARSIRPRGRRRPIFWHTAGQDETETTENGMDIA